MDGGVDLSRAASESKTTVAKFVDTFTNYFTRQQAEQIRTASGEDEWQITVPALRITANRADACINEMISVLQRKVDDEWVLELAEAQEKDTFDASIDPIIFFLFDGRVFLAGGRHRLMAQTVSDKTYEYPAIIRYIPTFERFIVAYRLTHGRKAASRSATNEMLLVRSPELETKTARDKVMAAVRCLIYHDLDPDMGFVRADSQSDITVAHFVDHYMEPAQKVLDIVFSRKAHPLFKKRFTAPFLAASIVVMKYSEVQATALLTSAAETGRSEPGSASLCLFNTLTGEKHRYESGEQGRLRAWKEFGYLWQMHCNGLGVDRIGNSARSITHLYGVPRNPKNSKAHHQSDVAVEKKTATLRAKIRELEEVKETARETILPRLIRKNALPAHLMKQHGLR